jgi:hypothetical protein
MGSVSNVGNLQMENPMLSPLRDITLLQYCWIWLMVTMLWVMWYRWRRWVRINHERYRVSEVFADLGLVWPGWWIKQSIEIYARILRHVDAESYQSFMGGFLWGIRDWVMIIGLTMFTMHMARRYLRREGHDG